MFLKRLELQGFKSFADKIQLDFDSGIVGIVGPNGSGKSNVTDGIRWLLGERDARNLRGGKVEDLIFAGTQKRARCGLAQASLYFDNTSGFFPVEFQEVSISRRVSRDGSSQFFLNKSEVRLKDVIDFFARSRLGARGLTIVGQGESDMFIKATPLERRGLVEEMLGLKEYQIKKADGVRRLKSTKINLDKAQATLDELVPRLKLLRRQMVRYEKKTELEQELVRLENGYYGSRLIMLQKTLESVSPRLKQIDESIAMRQKSLAEADKNFEEVKNSQPKASADTVALQEKRKVCLDKRAALQHDLGRIEAEMDFIARNTNSNVRVDLISLVQIISKIARETLAEDSIEAMKAGVAKIIETIESATQTKKQTIVIPPALKEKSAEITTAIAGLEKELAQLQSEEQGFADTLRAFNMNFQKAFSQVEREREMLARIRDERRSVVFEEEQVRNKLQELQAQIREAGKTVEEFQSYSGTEHFGDEVMRKMYQIRAELANIESIDETMVQEAKEAEEKFVFLTEQTADLQKAIEDLGTLIVSLDEKIHTEFTQAMAAINKEFDRFVQIMFGGGKAEMSVREVQEKRETAEGDVAGEAEEEKPENFGGIEINITLPRKRIKGLEVLSGGERSLVSVAALFALISVSPPPFLVLDEIDAALDERNARRFSDVLRDFAKKSQFIIVTHNRATMEAANLLYGVTMSDDGTSKVVSVKLSE